MNISLCCAIPNTLTATTETYATVIQEYVSKHGVKWNFNKHQDAPTGNLNGRQRHPTYVFREYYVCHRPGSKRVHVGVVRGGASGQIRGLQKRSKKINCPATSKVVCSPSDPSMVTITHSDNHNHEIGSSELPFLPVSVSVRALVEERLREGYSQRETRVNIQRNLMSHIRNNVLAGDSTHRDTLIHADEVYNIYKRIQEASYQRHQNQHQSVRAWLSELQQENFETFEGRDFMDSFSFGFISPFQKNLLFQARSVCLDATHSTTSFSNGILYTIVTRHPLTGTGCPVAFFFTIDQSMGPLANFLRFLRNQVGILNIEKITIDVSSTELGAIQAVYPSASVQWCLFHVARAWTGKIRQLVKPGDTHHNNTVQNKIIADLKAMMWERDRPVFTRKLTAFITVYSEYRDFLQYFKSRYLEDDAFMRWSAAYQPAMYTNMETNNYVESWHNQLKTNYLGRKRNRRVDRLVFVLVKDVLPEYANNISRIFSKVGRMGPEERRHRTREMQAEAISADALEQMIETARADSDGRSVYVVSSFSTSGVSYDVVVEDLQMITCSCPDFRFNNIACKHMYLLKRDMSMFSVFEVSFDPTFSTIPQNSPDSSALLTPTEQASPISSSNSSTEFDTLLSSIHKLKRQQYTLTETELEELNSFNQWFLSRIHSSNIPPNSNFTTQR